MKWEKEFTDKWGAAWTEQTLPQESAVKHKLSCDLV